MKEIVTIESISGAICNLEVDIVKNEGSRIIIKTWDQKYREFQMVKDSGRSYYAYTNDYNMLPE